MNAEDILNDPYNWNVRSSGNLVNLARAIVEAVNSRWSAWRWEAAMDAACFLYINRKRFVGAMVLGLLYHPGTRRNHVPRVRTDNTYSALRLFVLSENCQRRIKSCVP